MSWQMRRFRRDPAIDPVATWGEVRGELPKTKPQTGNSEAPERKRRAYGRWILLGLLVFLVAFVLWLNGPGIRWLAPRIAFHYLEGMGFSGDFEVEGTLSGGLSIVDLTLKSDEALALLTVDRATPHYRLGELRKGKLDGLTVEGVHADLRLGLEKEDDNEPLDLEKVVETLRNVRAQVVPLDLVAKDVSLDAKKDGEPVFALGSSSITHPSGSGVIDLELGEVTDATGKSWPEQATEIVWTEDSLSVARLDPLPGVSVRDFVMELPETGGPSVETELRVEEAVFSITSGPGLSTAALNLREGSVRVEEIAAKFGVESPLVARVTSLAVEVENLYPDPLTATGTARILLEDVDFEDYHASELNLDVTLGSDQVRVKAFGRAFENEININASAPLDRSEGGFVLGDIQGDFSGDDVPKLIAGIRSQVKSASVENAGAETPEVETTGNGTSEEEAAEKPSAAEAIIEDALSPEAAAAPDAVDEDQTPAAPEAVDEEETDSEEVEGEQAAADPGERKPSSSEASGGDGGGPEAVEMETPAADPADGEGSSGEAIIEDALMPEGAAAPRPADGGAGALSSVSGTFELTMEDNRLTGASAELTLQPADEDEAAPVDVTVKWEEDKPLLTTLASNGVEISGGYDFATGTYNASLNLDQFSKRRVARWLELAQVEVEGQIDLSGEWKGSGNFKEGTHQGELTLTESLYQRPDQPDITASGEIKYDWPGNVEAENLRLSTADQAVEFDAALAEGMLTIRRLLWTDDGVEIAEGSASLPVPEDFANWRETLANDQRPVELSIESRELPLQLLEPWLPEDLEIDPESTGRVSVNASGSFPDPEIEMEVELRNLRAPDNPDLPPADLTVELVARDGRIAIDGMATAPDFPPAVLKMEMAFRPAAWAEEPGLVMEETFEAKVELPRLDISRFSTLVPAARQLTGVITGNVVADGKLSDPKLRGNLRLAGGGLVPTNPDLPDLREVSADLDLNLERVLIENLRAVVAGGEVTGGGTIELSGAAPGEIDVQLRGNHLPIVRNEQMIIRANAALRVQGLLESARVTGTIGIVDSLFYRDIEILPIGRPFTGPAAASLPKIDTGAAPTAAVPAPFSNWELDVVVQTADPFLIRGNLGTGEVDVAIRVGGTIGNPAPDGTVRIRNAVASLPFSRLEVASGFLRFSPENGIDPTLEIRGVSEPRPYRVNIYVYGQLSDPQIILTSSPPLPDNEIMTLLATGTTTSGLEDPQAASSRAFQLLIEEARRGRLPFARQLRPVLKVLDRVDFNLSEQDPYDNDTFSTATIKLTERWYVSAGMGSEGNSRLLGLWRFSFR